MYGIIGILQYYPEALAGFRLAQRKFVRIYKSDTKKLCLHLHKYTLHVFLSVYRKNHALIALITKICKLK
jgi:hypothetical protein